MSNNNKNIIVPGKSAAGINLGDQEATLVEVLGEPIERINTRSGIVCLDYTYAKAWFDPGGKVTQIGLYPGYEGQTSDGIYIGLSKHELKDKWGMDLAYHEDDDYWEFINRPGILFNFSLDKQGVEKISKIFITDIPT